MRNYGVLAFGLSVCVHVFILTGISVPWLAKRTAAKPFEKTKELEILPREIEKINKDQMEEIEQVKPPPPCVDNLVQKILVDDAKAVSFDKPDVIVDQTKEIILSDIPQDKELKKIPAYMDYYRLVRERIRKNAYRYYTANIKGEVLLTFVVLKDGTLLRSYLNQGSVSNLMLRKIGIKSVKEASPFPPFPEELKDYASLQFNISIYFKNN